MPYIPKEVVEQARQMDLLTYLRNYDPQELVHFAGNTYCTREHDSLKISNGKWYWFSRSIGGVSALDYLIKVKGMAFHEAVQQITGQAAIQPPVFASKPKEKGLKVLLLPPVNRSNTHAVNYLQHRGIDMEIIDYTERNYISRSVNTMSIGERIRYFRSQRGMTQKWLGLTLGFSEGSADIRLAQYESGSRKPKEDLVKSLARIFEISPLALSVPNLDSDLGFLHTMFAIEDIFGIEVEKDSRGVHIIFDVGKATRNPSIYEMVTAWAEQSQRCKLGEIDKEEYDQWRHNFPEYDSTRNWVKDKVQ